MHEYSDILGPIDNAFYFVERRETPMNIGALTIFEGKIDYSDLLSFVQARIHQAPRYQQRVMQAAFNLGQPTWIADPDFYVGNHVKLVNMSPPATEEHLRETVERLLSKTLDRTKPLWEVYLIQGLENQSAVFFKVHHCMVDGLAAVDLFQFLLDISPKLEPPEERPSYDPPPLPTDSQLIIDSMLRDVSHRFGLLAKLGRETLRLGGLLSDSDKRLKMMLAMAHLINNNLKPIKKLPINGKNTGQQTMVWAEFSLDEVHAIRTRCKASVNDVMLAVLAKAVERYTLNRGGANQAFLRVLMPVNMREEGEKHDYGNRISVLPVDIPFNIADPLQHLTAVTRYTQVMKESSLAYSMDLVLTLPSLMPSPFQPAIWNIAPTTFSLLAHTWCTNVAAMPTPVYLLGHQLKHVYGFFPLNPSMGLACVIVSYNGRITMTLVLDKGIVVGVAELEQHMKDAYSALKRAANVPNLDNMHVAEKPVMVPALTHASANGESPGSKGDGGESNTLIAQSVPVAPDGIELISSNGSSRAVAPVAAPIENRVQEAVFKLFSEEWSKALQQVINQSVDYRRASTGWTAGSLAFIMEASPRHGFSEPSAVLLDLHRGECRNASALPIQDAMRAATFVIHGVYSAWMDVLSGRSNPLVMLTTGRLHLKKGSILRLLPYTRSATELVHCAQRVPWG